MRHLLVSCSVLSLYLLLEMPLASQEMVEEMKKRNSQRCKCQQMMDGPAAADPGAERKVGKSRGGGCVWVGFGRGKIEVGIQGTRKSSLD